MISYAGVPLGLVTPEIAAWIERHLSLADVYQFAWQHWPGHYLRHVGFPKILPNDRPVKPGCLFWPRGAARWAVAHFVVSQQKLDQIRAAMGGSYAAKQLVMTWVDHAKTEVGRIETNLYMLPARPLASVKQIGDGRPFDGNGFHLLTLVDERFFWWQKDSGDLTLTEGTTTWAQLLASLGTALGVTITPDSVPSAYLTPTAELRRKYAWTPVLLDAAAFAVGQRIVRKLDGSVVSQNATSGKSSVNASLALPAARSVYGGGLLAFDSPNDLASEIPGTVRVCFAKSQDGIDQADPYPLTATFSGLGMGSEVRATPNGFTQTFRHPRVATLTTAGGGTATNNAALQALTDQIAHDYYRFQGLGPRLDRKYAGIVSWTPDSLHASVEWTYRLGEISTRVQSGNLEMDFGEHEPAERATLCLDFAASVELHTCPASAAAKGELCLDFAASVELHTCPAAGKATGDTLCLDFAAAVELHTCEDTSDGVGGSPLTTKGDLYTYSTADDRLPVGTDGQFLTADSGEATGLKWVDTGGIGLAGSNAGSSSGTTGTMTTILDVSAANGLIGVIGIKNTGATHALNIRTTLYSVWGSSNNNYVSVTAGNTRDESVEVGLGTSIDGPYNRITVEVEDNNPGNHTTYDFKWSLVVM